MQDADDEKIGPPAEADTNKWVITTQTDAITEALGKGSSQLASTKMTHNQDLIAS